MKKLIALLLVITMLLSFAACSKKNNGTQSTPETPDNGNSGDNGETDSLDNSFSVFCTVVECNYGYHTVVKTDNGQDKEALELRGITDAQAHFEAAIKEINAKNVSYKRVDRVKLRDEEFPKNTSKKITRFKIDKTV